MIEISHTQARRLIRLALDRSILDAQWNAGCQRAGTAVPAWLGDEQVYELDWH